MHENSPTPRHIDGSVAVTETEFFKITFQHGAPHDDGINGCRLEDVIDALNEKLLDFQSRALACEENETAIYHLGQAKDALELRRRRRERQGVLGTDANHEAD